MRWTSLNKSKLVRQFQISQMISKRVLTVHNFLIPPIRFIKKKSQKVSNQCKPILLTPASLILAKERKANLFTWRSRLQSHLLWRRRRGVRTKARTNQDWSQREAASSRRRRKTHPRRIEKRIRKMRCKIYPTQPQTCPCEQWARNQTPSNLKNVIPMLVSKNLIKSVVMLTGNSNTRSLLRVSIPST